VKCLQHLLERLYDDQRLEQVLEVRVLSVG
jgi:hypothetical protein